jgi:hypothetical protein
VTGGPYGNLIYFLYHVVSTLSVVLLLGWEFRYHSSTSLFFGLLPLLVLSLLLWQGFILGRILCVTLWFASLVTIGLYRFYFSSTLTTDSMDSRPLLIYTLLSLLTLRLVV